MEQVTLRRLVRIFLVVTVVSLRSPGCKMRFFLQRTNTVLCVVLTTAVKAGKMYVILVCAQ